MRQRQQYYIIYLLRQQKFSVTEVTQNCFQNSSLASPTISPVCKITTYKEHPTLDKAHYLFIDKKLDVVYSPQLWKLP